ncbi:MAG TPA: Rieske 2Fe-2S domain-containing protein [Usitatibacter sp.]|nr:Rieske 2Fe-2S domain-containing protein [Usitatibacter sp.]HST01793.1 Rieske 2Fe-2S domain-containing protein [Usitatibacter sp.]
MAREPRVICASAELVEGGRGVRFSLASEGGEEKGFAIRCGGTAHGYLNRCPHAWTELDWNPGEFFDQSGLHLVCSTHGAMFEPNTGYCVAGPCHGASLERLELREQEGRVLLLNDDP